MSTEKFMPASASSQSQYGFGSSQPLSPMSQPNNPFETAMAMPSFTQGSERSNGRSDQTKMATIRVRRLPRSTSNDTLRTLFLFAKDFVGADLVPNEYTEDTGYSTAIAKFKSTASAHEAQSLLNGKPNATNDGTMVVEVLHHSPGAGSGVGARRNTLDAGYARNAPSSASSTGSSSGQNTRQSSRFNGTFQALDGASPPGLNNFSKGNAQSSGDSGLETFQFFSTTSPIGQPIERQRVSGKSVIGEDGVDEETDELLKNPLAFNTGRDPTNGLGRRQTVPHLPTSQFSSLNLNNNGLVSPIHGFPSPRPALPMQSPTSLSPTGMASLGPNATYQLANQHYQRHNYPPVNPADQNPPCNTLYVGNLPIDTSEDELKAMFSKQRGYKRLCFRTKQNGPMCFVEFEDVSFATKALNDLYGHPLHNSVKGGIRLSFSKNPLGVRTGQPGGMGLQTPMSPQGPMSGMNSLGSMQSFSTANGPPPGLTAPPGLNPTGSGSMNGLGSPTGQHMMSGNLNTMNGLGMGGMGGMRSPHGTGNMVNATAAGGMWASGYTGQLTDYMVGR
ncbi:MAG: hypothetical protein MMC33_004394 [Icmadophila ericetorum]|nr:hypothetical protein [Icmadophila ericetorum]